jgi:hypothetical protein
MASEESPSLTSSSLSHGQVYNHFSPRRKVAIVALVSIAGLLPRELTIGCLNSRPPVNDKNPSSIRRWIVHPHDTPNRPRSALNRAHSQVRTNSHKPTFCLYFILTATQSSRQSFCIRHCDRQSHIRSLLRILYVNMSFKINIVD